MKSNVIALNRARRVVTPATAPHRAGTVTNLLRHRTALQDACAVAYFEGPVGSRIGAQALVSTVRLKCREDALWCSKFVAEHTGYTLEEAAQALRHLGYLQTRDRCALCGDKPGARQRIAIEQGGIGRIWCSAACWHEDMGLNGKGTK